MDIFNPTVFLFSAALAGLSITLLLLVSRPGLPEDQPALALWVVGDLAITLHRVTLLLQPGTLDSAPDHASGLETADFLAADAGFVVLGMACFVKALSMLCGRPLGRWTTAGLLAILPLGLILLLQWLPSANFGQLAVLSVAGGLALMQVRVTWRAVSESRGLKILTVANGLITAMMLFAVVGVCAQIHAGAGWAAEWEASPTQGPFLPHFFGIVGDFVASITRTFAVSLVLQERQRACILKLSSTDVLTGALNRRGALPLIEHALHGALRFRHPLSIAILDIDHFKRVNDRLGHDAGDAVLRAFSLVLHEHKRKTDILARWGGEEFVLVLPETGNGAAAALLNRLREVLPACLAGRAPCGVTFSAGVATLEADAPTASIDALLTQADRCLYDAKVTRDCVVPRQPAPVPERPSAGPEPRFVSAWT